MGDDSEPIEDDELLYRRVQLVHFDPSQGPCPSPQAFRATAHDETGVSVFRAKFTTVEDVVRNDRGKSYYVAVLRAGNLRANCIDVVPKPQEDRPGHAELPGLTYENRKSDTSEEARQLLARKLCLQMLGPFPESA